MLNYSSPSALSQEVTAHQMALPGIAGTAPAPFYIPLPYTLLSDLRHAPAAIGAYAVIARQFRLSRGAPVFLSTNDLMAYDPCLSTGSARRAFRLLLAKGYVTIAETHGNKRGYVPTWGRVSGEPRLWDISAPILNRPPHIRAYRLDQRFLDTCMGILEPHRQHAAKIERYVIKPILGLREIGEYALNATGYFTPSAKLENLGLLRTDLTFALPGDDTLLAYASQPGQGGLTRLGWTSSIFPDEIQALQTPGTPAANSRSLFFVPPEMIAGRIADVIPCVITGVIADSERGEEGINASESQETPVENAAPGSHESMNLDEGDEDQDPPPTRASALNTKQGGDIETPTIPDNRTSRTPRQPALRTDEIPLPKTEAVELLQSIGVMPSSIRLYMHDPLESVRAAVEYAREYPGARDPGALAVKALRDMRLGWNPSVWANRYPNQIAPREDGPEVWELPEHDYKDLAAEIMPDWALAKSSLADIQCLAAILGQCEGDEQAALEQFARENWKRSGWGKEASCA